MRTRKEHAVGPRGFSRWVQPRPDKYFMVCCDCGLVHEMQFRIAKGKTIERVQFRARRARNKTSEVRKSFMTLEKSKPGPAQ